MSAIIRRFDPQTDEAPRCPFCQEICQYADEIVCSSGHYFLWVPWWGNGKYYAAVRTEDFDKLPTHQVKR